MTFSHDPQMVFWPFWRAVSVAAREHKRLDPITSVISGRLSQSPKSRSGFDRGASFRRDRGIEWIVAHHVPPPLRPDATWEEDEAGELLDRYRPDYWLSGHIHNLRYASGNTWRAQFGKTDGVDSRSSHERPISESHHSRPLFRISRLAGVSQKGKRMKSGVGGWQMASQLQRLCREILCPGFKRREKPALWFADEAAGRINRQSLINFLQNIFGFSTKFTKRTCSTQVSCLVK